MLQVDLVGTVASLALLVALPDSIPAPWIGTVGSGFFVASMISSSFSLAERRMPVTGHVSAAFRVGGSLGTMTLPWLVGQLFVPVGRLAVMNVTGAAMLSARILFALIVRHRQPSDASGPAPAPAPSAG